MAQQEDFKIDQGSDVAIQLDLQNIDGSKKNLSGYSVAAKLKRTYSTADSDAISFTTSILSPDSDGKISLSLTNTQTDNLNDGLYVYDVEISYFDSDSDQIVERILQGYITVTPSVTI